MIKPTEITIQNEWDKIVTSFDDHTILQSWAWGEFRQALGEKVFRFAYNDNETVIGAALITIEKTKYGKWLYCGYAPLTNWNKPQYKKILEHLKELGKQESCDYLTIDPQLIDIDENKRKLQVEGFREAHRHIQANHKWLLDITKDEETLLKEMRKNTRYSINKATKEGVKVKKSGNIKDFLIFKEAISDTASRKKFFVEFKKLEKEFENLSKYDNMLLLWAEYQGKPVSAALISYYGKHAGYLWGATVNGLPNSVPAAYPVLWESILEAKNRGVEVFDFWGIAPPESKNHPWQGFTFFKTGFGGYYKKLILPFDYPLTWKYWLIQFIAKSRKVWGVIYKAIKLG